MVEIVQGLDDRVDGGPSARRAYQDRGVRPAAFEGGGGAVQVLFRRQAVGLGKAGAAADCTDLPRTGGAMARLGNRAGARDCHRHTDAGIVHPPESVTPGRTVRASPSLWEPVQTARDKVDVGRGRRTFTGLFCLPGGDEVAGLPARRGRVACRLLAVELALDLAERVVRGAEVVDVRPCRTAWEIRTRAGAMVLSLA